MSGNTNFPTALDDDTSLISVSDGVTSIAAAHHNNLKEAVKALQAKIGIFNSGAPTSIDFRLSNATLGHSHNGASGQGGAIAASAISGLATIAAGLITQRHIVPWYMPGQAGVDASVGIPFAMARTMQLESISGRVKIVPSGGDTKFSIHFGPTSVWGASPAFGPRFLAGTYGFMSASPNLVTYPSGAMISFDVDDIGLDEPGQEFSFTFIFRD